MKGKARHGCLEPKMDGFIMENPIKNGCFGGTAIFGNIHIEIFTPKLKIEPVFLAPWNRRGSIIFRFHVMLGECRCMKMCVPCFRLLTGMALVSWNVDNPFVRWLFLWIQPRKLMAG